MNKNIIIFLILLLPTIALAVTPAGELYNGYSYDHYYIWESVVPGPFDDMSLAVCDPRDDNKVSAWSSATTSSYGNWQINEINVNTGSVISSSGEDHGTNSGTQQYRRYITWIDCYNDILYMVPDAGGGDYRVFSYTLSNYNYISASAVTTASSYISNHGPSFAKINNDNHYFALGPYLYKIDSDGLFSVSITRTLDSYVLDMVSDGAYLYVLTHTGLYKYDDDLFEVEYTTNSDIVVEHADRAEHYMYYNNYKDLLFIRQAYDQITAFNPNTFITQYTSTPDFLMTETNNYQGPHSEIEWGSKSFYFNANFYNNGTALPGESMVVCEYESGDCEIEFQVGQFENWTYFYASTSVNTGVVKDDAWVLLDGNLVFVNTYPTIGIMSGFDKIYEFVDTFSINNMTVNKTPNLVNTDINVTIQGTHTEGNEYLTYGISCDSSGTNIFTQIFNKNSEVDNSSMFDNYCADTKIRPDSFGLETYALYVDDCTLGTYYSLLNKLITGAFSFNMDIGISDGHEFTIHLLGTETEIVEDGSDKTVTEEVITALTYSFDESTQTLTIYNTHTEEVVFAKLYDLSLTPYIYTDRLFISTQIMVDFVSNELKIGVKNYGSEGYTYTDGINLTPEKSVNVFEVENVTYIDNIMDTYVTVDNTDYYFIEEDESHLNGTTVINKELNICKYLEKVSDGPIIRDFMIVNTTDGLNIQYGNNFTITQAFSWICSDDYNTRSPVYPNNTIFDKVWYGFQCVNCGPSVKLRLGVDTTSPNATSFYSTEFNSTFNLYTDDYMITADEILNFETLTSINYLTNLEEYKIIEYDTTDNEFHTEITNIGISKNYLPTLSTSNNGTCSYTSPGVYTITGYLSSSIDKNYNTFTTRIVEIVPTEPSDIGNAFDPLLESDDFTSGFWKFIMFLSFTIMILVSAGLFNSEGGQVKHPELIWIEFLIFETFMLFIMSKVFSFFPMYYFILDLMVVAATLVYYIKKVFN